MALFRDPSRENQYYGGTIGNRSKFETFEKSQPTNIKIGWNCQNLEVVVFVYGLISCMIFFFREILVVGV